MDYLAIRVLQIETITGDCNAISIEEIALAHHILRAGIDYERMSYARGAITRWWCYCFHAEFWSRDNPEFNT